MLCRRATTLVEDEWHEYGATFSALYTSTLKKCETHVICPNGKSVKPPRFRYTLGITCANDTPRLYFENICKNVVI